MKDVIYKKSGLRTAGKVFAVIGIVVNSIAIIGAVTMFVLAILAQKAIDTTPSMPTADKEKLLKAIRIFKIMGITSIVIGVLGMGFTIWSLQLLKKSVSFGFMLSIGIVNIITCSGIILGILMIIIACAECLNYNKKKTKK